MPDDALMEIYNFGAFWRSFDNFQVLPTGNFTFEEDIEYESETHGKDFQSCAVMISRTVFTDGQVDVLERGEHQSETHHLRFYPKY